jgi:uncharacterized membrane protein
MAVTIGFQLWIVWNHGWITILAITIKTGRGPCGRFINPIYVQCRLRGKVIQHCSYYVGVSIIKGMETRQRTIARMVTYRITAWLFTILWTYLFTGDMASATGFATALHILLSIDYYVHERIWLKIRWGRTDE